MGAPFDARFASEFGLITQVVSDKDVLVKATETARELSGRRLRAYHPRERDRPSVTLTHRLRKRLESDPSVQKMAAAHLVGLAEPVDIAHAALYLASDESRMITGQILRVDGGITIV